VQDDALSTLLRGIPHSLLLENAKKDLWLLVPNTPLKRPTVFTCPFSTELLAARSDPRWLATMDTRFFVYPVHVSHTFLHSATLASTFYLLVLALLSRDYLRCSRLLETCEIDVPLGEEERFVFGMVEQSLHDQHPDAHAIRLKLFVCVWLSGSEGGVGGAGGSGGVGWKNDVQGDPWDLCEEYSNYLRKLGHISAPCRLSPEEEEVVYQQVVFEEKQRRDPKTGAEGAPPKEQINRAKVRKAISDYVAERKKKQAQQQLASGSGASVAAASTSAALDGDDEAPPARAELSFALPRRDGLTSAWWDWCSKVSSYFASEWSPGLTWSGMVCFARPAARMRRGVDLIASTVAEALEDGTTGSTHKLGFLFLMDLLLGSSGGVFLDPSDPAGCADCSFSLGRLLAQWGYLKHTGWGEKVPPRPGADMLPYAVTAVFASGFIPTPNNVPFRKMVTSIPAFPPLPVVLPPGPVAEQAMAAGFLLHKKGTPVNQLFVLLAQWSAGFVRMAREWGVLVSRPVVVAETTKQGYADLEEWPSGQPSNTACKERVIEPFVFRDDDNGREGDKCVLDVEELACLASRNLDAVDVEEFLVEVSAAGAATNSSEAKLPFDVSSHPTAQTSVARAMLTRMEADVAEYASQRRSARNYQLKGVTTAELERIARDKSTAGIADSQARISLLHEKLSALREGDWVQVCLLRQVLLRLANFVPGLSPASPSASSNATTASVPALRFALSRYAGQRFTVSLDYLTALLLSTRAEVDLASLNPFLSPRETRVILRLLAALLLRTSRVGLVDRVLFELEEMRSAMRTLEKKVELAARARQAPPSGLVMARSLSGGTQMLAASSEKDAGDEEGVAQRNPDNEAEAELQELVQQMSIQSSTLAESLLTARHYMTSGGDGGTDRSDAASSSSDPLGGAKEKETVSCQWRFDPRFLVFEYLFTILLRSGQVGLLRSFSSAGYERRNFVAQMLMGGGKSTVVGPLLAMMLADGQTLVTMVVPSALLPMSRALLRARFSSLVPKRIHTLSFDRQTKDDPALVAKLLYKLYAARERAGVVIATAVSVKSLLLKYLELLVALQAATSSGTNHLTPGEQEELRNKNVVAEGLAQVMAMWREGVLILDEIDLLLHPLKSELNFPCGPRQALSPAPNRWELPMHLLDAFFHAETGHLSVSAFHELLEAQEILDQLRETLERGVALHALQRRPHIILLHEAFYHTSLKPLLGRWALLWLKARGMASIPEEVLLEYIVLGWSRREVSEVVQALLGAAQMVLLNLAHQWLNSFLPHVLAKINRVGYGLLRDEEIAQQDMVASSSGGAGVGGGATSTRRLVAVPFLAKDVPSRSSEFAHAEVIIGLTTLAYRIEGLRRSDLRHVISTMKQAASMEQGPEHQRPSAKRFDMFVRQARALHARRRAQREKEQQEQAAIDASADASPSSSSSSSASAAAAVRRRRLRDRYAAEASLDARLSKLRILPLSQFSLADPLQLEGLFHLVRRLPSLLDYYLGMHLFPSCMHHQLFNLSASGQDLGNGMLFRCSLGFSGTPSDLLPLELGKCHYERGSDGLVLSVLSDPRVVSYSIKSGGWSVRSLLRDIAQSRSPVFHSLIDTGALITGMENKEVALFLLEAGLHSMDGVVYLDEHDQQMILLRTSGGIPIPASQCGVAPSRRFSFFDQIHTTGIDIRHSPSSVAVLTLGKDMTFRDYAQGAFRMRQIGQGQKLHLYVIPEVLKLVERECNRVGGSGATKGADSSSEQQLQQPPHDADDDGVLDVSTSSAVSVPEPLRAKFLVHVSAWLTVNSMRMEQLQFYQLCLQNLHSVWRKRAFDALLRDSLVPSPSSGGLASRRHLRFDLSAPVLHEDILWLSECLSLFKVGVSTSVPDHLPRSKPFFAALKTMLSQHTPFLAEDSQCLAVAAVLTAALESDATSGDKGMSRNALEQEMVVEQEREQEQEKHTEVLRDPRAARNEETHQPWSISKLRSADALAPVPAGGGAPDDGRLVPSHLARSTVHSHPFYSLASLALDGRPLPLVFPRWVLMSHSYFRQSWALRGGGSMAHVSHRRLKNVYVMLEWCPGMQASVGAGASASSVAAASSSPAPPASFLAPSSSTPLQADRWQRAFDLLDMDGDGLLRGAEIEVLLRRVLQGLIDPEEAEAEDEDDDADGSADARGKGSPHASFFAGVPSLDRQGLQRLVQALTKRPAVEKLAGFVQLQDQERKEDEDDEKDGGGAEQGSSGSGPAARRYTFPSARELLSAGGRVEDSGRYFVVLPLSEAQWLRRAVHTSHPLFRTPSGLQIALWTLEGHLLEATPHYRPATLPADAAAGAPSSSQLLSCYQRSVSLQLGRFLNGELFFSEAETVALLRGLGAVHPAHRRTLLDQVLLARHRDHRTVEHTPVAQALQLDDEAHWFLLRCLRVRLRAACEGRGLSLLQAFHLFDLDGDGRLDADELWTACDALGLAAAVRPGDVVDLLGEATGHEQEEGPSPARASAAAGSGNSSKASKAQGQSARNAIDFTQWAALLRTREEAALEAEGALPFVGRGDARSDVAAPASASSIAPAALPKLTLLRMPAPERPLPPPAFVPPVAATTQAPSVAAAVPPPSSIATPRPAPASTPAATPAATTWACAVCTYLNGAGRTRCEMCDTPRGS